MKGSVDCATEVAFGTFRDDRSGQQSPGEWTELARSDTHVGSPSARFEDCGGAVGVDASDECPKLVPVVVQPPYEAVSYEVLEVGGGVDGLDVEPFKCVACFGVGGEVGMDELDVVRAVVVAGQVNV